MLWALLWAIGMGPLSASAHGNAVESASQKPLKPAAVVRL